MKELESRAATALRDLVGQVPVLQVENIEIAPGGLDRRFDMLAHIKVSGRPYTLICEIKPSGQPRHVRAGLTELRYYVAHSSPAPVPVFIAPYLSPEARKLCTSESVGFLDLVGNARLVFDSVFIEKIVPDKPAVERRELRSLFKPKSAQVLRVLLRDPKRAWRVTELAEVSAVSLGHVSNVRSGLLDREWAQVSEQGLFLSEPDALLDAWRDEYEAPAGKRIGFYTTLHGMHFEESALGTLGVQSEKGRAMFASFSAANWLAPYARTGTEYFYADKFGLERLKERLKLSPTLKGENVLVTVPEDGGVFRDTVEFVRGAFCTSAIQTYLDLWIAGERGREAAEHLRLSRLSWPK